MTKIRWAGDPLKKIVAKKKLPKHTTRAFAVMFKHLEGWTTSGVEFHRESAIREMKRQREQSPDFKYKVVPCEIWIGQHFIKAPAMPPMADH